MLLLACGVLVDGNIILAIDIFFHIKKTCRHDVYVYLWLIGIDIVQQEAYTCVAVAGTMSV